MGREDGEVPQDFACTLGSSLSRKSLWPVNVQLLIFAQQYRVMVRDGALGAPDRSHSPVPRGRTGGFGGGVLEPQRTGLEEEATHWGLWPGVKCEFRVALTLTGGGWRGDPLVGEGARQAGPLECTACAPCPAELQMPPMCKMSVQESDHTQCRKSLRLKTGQSLPLLAKSLRWFRSEVCLWNSRRTPV